MAAGDVAHGLGWIVVLLGIGAAASPYVATGLRRETRWRAMLAALAAGALIVVYLITSRPSDVAVGLPVVVVGYVMEWVALLREREIAPATDALPAAAVS